MMGTDQIACNVDVDGGVVANSDVAPPWLRRLLFTNLYTCCSFHSHLRRRFCMTCMGEALCDVCARSHPQQHPILEVHKVSGFPSLRIDDVKKLIDVSDIHPFVINHHRVVRLHRDHDHLRKKQVLKAGHCCSNCSKMLQDSNYHFCSIVCKIDAITSCGEESNLKRSLELPEENKERIDMINTVVEPLRKKSKRERRGIRRTKEVLVQIKEERKSTATDEAHKLPRKSDHQNENGECSIKRIRLTIRKKTDRESQLEQVPAPQQLPSPPTCRRRHRRKGIPTRAPIF